MKIRPTFAGELMLAVEGEWPAGYSIHGENGAPFQGDQR
jgi:hypothetical protein